MSKYQIPQSELSNILESKSRYALEIPVALGGLQVAGRSHVHLYRNPDEVRELTGLDAWSASWNTWHRGQCPASGATPQAALDALFAS